uniref:Tc1-like transposase DDE domain-containing protein n=1 Tax=Sander lucioperca TaxID=283035 RepID=A0A8C9Z751_SANLU
MLTFDGVWHFGEVFSSRMNPGFHCTGICTQFLEAESIAVLAKPAYSPDMSPIEHVWDLGRSVRARVTNTTTLADLQQILGEEWDAIPQQCVTRLVTSRRRC